MHEIHADDRAEAADADLLRGEEAEGRISAVQCRAADADLDAAPAHETARVNEERLRFLSDNLPDSALYEFTRDEGGTPRLLYISAGIERLTGIRPENALRDARLVLGQIPEEHRPRILEAEAKSARELSDVDLEMPIRRADGELRWMRMTARPRRSPDGRVTWDGVQTDVTERRRAEEALKLANERKGEFLAMLAHELRNPLAPIRNAAQILRRRGLDDSGVEGAHATIDRQLNHLVRLIDDLLDVSRVSRGRIALQTGVLDLSEVVRQTVESTRDLLDTRGQLLTVTLPSEPVHVAGDFTRLSQVAYNLLSNAVKYTDAGGQIALTLERTRKGELPEAVLRVRDSGIGLDPAAIGSVFDLFFQVDCELDRSEGGMGIGLSLARSLVELHGGRVEAHSQGLGQGSEFVVRLPALPLPEARPSLRSVPPAAPESAPRRLRVLVVDDNFDAAETMAMLLELEGHVVQIAHDGQEAVTIALAERPDVVLLDIGLPKLNGYEACKAMREGGLTGALIIATTGYGQDEDRRLSRQAGFDSHQLKPLRLSMIHELLGQHAAAIDVP
jgi:PAS domain S-box-containing protein